MKKFSLLLFIFLCLTTTVSAVDITGCTTITTGGTYNLTQNITYSSVAGDVSSNDCITVNTSGFIPVVEADVVFLRCNGYTITVNMQDQQQNAFPTNGYAPIHIVNSPGTQIINCKIVVNGGNTTAVGVYIENTTNQLYPGGMIGGSVTGGGIECYKCSKFNFAAITITGGNLQIQEVGASNPNWATTLIINNHITAKNTSNTGPPVGGTNIGQISLSSALKPTGGYLTTSDYVISGNVLDGSWTENGPAYASGTGISLVGPTQRFEIYNNTIFNDWGAGIELINSHQNISIHDNTITKFGIACFWVDWNISLYDASFTNNTCDDTNLNASLFTPDYPVFILSQADTFLPVSTIFWKNVTFTGNVYKSPYRITHPDGVYDVMLDLTKFGGTVNVSGTNTWTNNTFSNNDRKAHTVKISPSTLVSDGGGNKCNWVWTPLNPVPYPITCTQ